jgi:hypothetical protein
MPHDVVISYSRRNRDIADRFAALLRERGLDVWYDRMIKTGADWRDEIARAIAGSRAFVILFSAESNESEELKKEYSIADRRDLVIVPIRVENVEPTGFFEYELSRRQWFDAFSDRDAQLAEAAQQLAETLKPSAEPHSPDPAPEKTAEPKPPRSVTPDRPSPAKSADGVAPSSRGRWVYLALAGLNFLLGVVPTYLLLWPLTQVAFTRVSARGRTLPLPVNLFSYAIVGGGVATLCIYLLGGLREDVVLILGVLFAAAGIAITAYVAVQAFGRGAPVAFWIAPALGAALIGLALALSAYVEDDYIWSVAVGMTIANGAFLFDAWKRMTAGKP